MAKMLGDTPHGRFSIYKGWRNARKPSEMPEIRRNQRARERSEVRRITDEHRRPDGVR